MYVDSLHAFSFRQPDTGHMALLLSAKQQCHNTYGTACKVDMQVIPHYLLVTLILDLLCNVYTLV